MTSLFTGLGFFLIDVLPKPFGIASVFLTPVYFLSTLVRSARAPVDWLAMGFGLALAPLAQAYVGGGLDLLVLGLGGGTAAYLTGRLWRRGDRAT